MCYCNDRGFWACDEEGACGPGSLIYERSSYETGRADDDCSSDPEPTSWDSSDASDGQWYCTACSDNPSTIHYIIRRESCCCTEDEDCGCEACTYEPPPTPDEALEQLCADEQWVWLVRADDDSFTRVSELRAIVDDFPEELGRLYERRSITRLLVKSERASHIVQYMAHSAVEVQTLTDHERTLYVLPDDEPPREEDPNQCRLTV